MASVEAQVKKTFPRSEETETQEPVRSPWVRLAEEFGENFSDLLNPLLIKEARQSLKSRQFAMIFVGVLICCWAWSTIGTAILGPEINTRAAGGWIFRGYYAILSFPLLIVVPFNAFRSLTSEREDKTFELIQITTLRPRQAVMGKIVSALVQILLFVSATAPCMAFTYMLRGIDMLTIGISVVFVVALSVLLTAAAVFLATMYTEKHQNNALSVLLASALFFAWWASMAWAIFGISDLAMLYNSNQFASVASTCAVVWIAYFSLFLVWAASRLTFESDNRSTAVRWILHLHPCLLFGFFAGLYTVVRIEAGGVGWSEFIAVASTFFSLIVGVHWMFFGSLLAGEPLQMSDRVKRSLPNGFVGRSLFTWFNPGPYTAYVLVAADLLAWGVLLTGLMLTPVLWDGLSVLTTAAAPVNLATSLCMVWGTFGYVVFFLGLSLCFTTLLRRISPESGPMLSFVMSALLLIAAFGIPLSIQYSWTPPREEWTYLQIFNPFWTLYGIFHGPPTADVWLVPTTVILASAAVVFAINLPGIEREIHYVRAATPMRVEQDDAALKPASPPQSPWDVDVSPVTES